MAKERIFKVSEFNDFINLHLDLLGEVVVEGEISQVSVKQDKWIYATIKDEKASVDVFGSVFDITNHDVFEEGMLVHVYGAPRLYLKTGRFSITTHLIIPAGEGSLRVAFEKLRLKLEREGLFEVARKRSLPRFPEQIGLITAKDSRAYDDFIKVLNARMGGMKICFYPVQVQGRDSVAAILAAFDYFNDKLPELDLLVLTRGGGSLEDLMSFNDEQVARAIFSSKVPVVCGVGHEKDITLSDLVADLRASTPSNAAELIVRHRDEALREIDSAVKFWFIHLHQLLSGKQQKVVGCVNKMHQGLNHQVRGLHFLIARFSKEFALFGQSVTRTRSALASTQLSLLKAISSWHQKYAARLQQLARLLNNLDYRNLLSRGFSITMDKDGKIVKSIQAVHRNQKINTLLFDGAVYSEVTEIRVKND